MKKTGLALSAFQAVIFDLDGTLVDSMWVWEAIDAAYLARFHITVPEGLQTELNGKNIVDTARYFQSHFDIRDEVSRIIQDWEEMAICFYRDQIPLKPGVLPFLEKCKEYGIPIGIASSNSKRLIAEVLHTHQIDSYFSCIRSGNDALPSKPAPDIYLNVAKGLNRIETSCLVFEDLIEGIQAGKAAGMTVCAVKDDYSMNQWEDKKSLADDFISDYREYLTR